MNSLFLLIPIAIIAIIVIIAIAAGRSDYSGSVFEAPQRRAGRRGEKAATDIIKTVLRDDDYMYTNIEISFEGKPAELDNVIVNKYGVFIIEVKNYNGKLVGTEDDYEWTKYHRTSAGNVYSKTVKNPIKQVKRQIYILAHFLDYYGTKVWVSGYALLLHGNSPVTGDYVLSSAEDIDRAIHTSGRQRLNQKTIDSIRKLLE